MVDSTRRHRAVLEDVEPRILYAADHPAAALATPLLAEEAATVARAEAQPEAETPRDATELVFIDERVPDADLLVADITAQAAAGRHIEVVRIGADDDGIARVSATLAERSDVTAVHVVAHGSAGSVTLGNTTLDQEALLLRAGEIAAWGDHLSGDADLLLYGCDVASTANGQALVQNLAQLTGADVAASDNLTGAAGLGGDWVLEMQTGTIQAASAIDAAGKTAFNAVLATYTVTNTNDSGAGSLRAAITSANGNAGTDNINFTIAGTGVHTITLASALPSITGTVIINGTTDDSFAANGNKPAIVINGNGLNADGLSLSATADGSTIRGLVIRNFASAAININAGSDSNTIVGNYLGAVDATGNLATASNASYTMFIAGANNTVGGSTAADRNVLGTNGNGGVYSVLVFGSSATGNQILGNYIGIGADGSTAFSGTQEGIDVSDGVATRIEGNVIAADGTDGIYLSTAGTGTVINNNLIGTNAAGTALVSAPTNGIRVFQAGSGTVITNNVIAGASLSGITLEASTSGVTVQGNRIGTDAAGTANWGAQRNGIQITSSNHVIGGTGAGQGNTIANSNQAASTYDGIAVSSGTGNAILGNSIHSNGQGIDLGTTGVTANDAGDTDTGPNNLQNFPVLTVARTDSTGQVFVAGTLSTNTGTRYYRVEFFASPTGDASGNGEGQTYLGFVNVPTTGGTGSFSATLSATVPLGYAISSTATRATDGTYSAFTDTSEFSANLLATASSEIAVTTSADNNDSGISAGNATHTLNWLAANKGTDGLVSLREAIIAANNTTNGSAPDRITFAISGTGVHTITLGSALPSITGAVVIDATTDDSFVVNSSRPAIILDGNSLNRNGLVLASGSGGSTIRGLVIRNFDLDGIQINSGSDGNTIAGNYIGSLAASGSGGGVGNGGAGIYVLGANNTIGGTTATDRNLISGNANGILINGASGNQVVGNYIGTNLAGTAAIANTGDGIRIEAGSTGNTVGGSNTNQRNIISGNGDDGIQIDGETSDGNTIKGNWIGVGADGTTLLGTGGDGIFIRDGADNTVIGGTGANDGNWIAGGLVGIETDGPISGTLVQGNRIGTDLAGTANWGMQQNGILIENSLGGAAPSSNLVADNIVAFSGQANAFTSGIAVLGTAGSGNTLLRNLVYSSVGLGIDLGTTGVTANDAGDADTGANNLQNFPVLTLARTDGSSQLQLAGTLNSTASSYYRLEFFASTTADASGYGEGQTYLGFVNVSTDGSGNANFATALSVSVPVGYSVSASATRSNAAFNTFTDTSEFSAAQVAAGPVVHTVPGAQNIAEDVGTAIGGISVSAPFASGISTTLAVANGTLQISLAGGASISTGANGSTSLTLSGTVTQVNAALATLQYTGASNYNGSDTLSVATTDGTGGSDADNMAITVTPVNDAPVITSNGGGASAALSVAENGTAVTAVAASDADGSALTYSISGGADAALFQINASTGTVSFVSAPDFENPTDAGANNVYNLQVRVSDGSQTDTQNLAVTVTNANDNAPVITSHGGGNTASVSMAENGTAVTTVTASDVDGPTLTYSIVGGADAALFQINASTGALSFVSTPDYENPTDTGANNVYDVTVGVSDGFFADTQAIAVSLTNLNDSAPTITSNGGGASASINEAENATTVTTVTATDADGSTLAYSIVGGADAALFQINSSTGALSFVSAPDFENPQDAAANNVYDVTVQASDGSLADTQNLAVTVTDVNDNAPVITSNGSAATTSVSIAENGTTVTTVTATDADGPSLSYSIVGGADAARFQINSSTGALSFVAAPDYESPTDAGSNNVYDVTVQASDGSLTDTQAIAVTVSNLNDNAPVLTSNGGGASAVTSVAELTTAVTTVAALDADGSALSYSIVGGADAALFTVNASTGALRFVAGPDFENPQDTGNDNVYDVQVQASDGTFADTQSIAVTVTDLNDGAPNITSDGGGATAAVSVAENTIAVTTVIAIDSDSPTLIFTIIGGADAARFAIDTNTGVLSFLTAPDYENPQDVGPDNVYDVQVQVSDGGFTDTQAIAVTVTNSNDNPPAITSSGGGATASTSLAENGTAVTTVVAYDVDGSTLTYSISGGADAAMFQIDSSTGALRFVSAPDFESPADAGTNNVYDVTVQVSDGSAADTQALAVTVNDVNDVAPTITSNGGGTAASISIAENGTAVATVTATDADSPTLTYSIGGGADAALFQIDASTGVLRFVAAPDFESPTDAGANNLYNLQVLVSDGVLVDTQNLAVTVTNLNDIAPVITSNGGGATASVSTPENGTAVTTVASSDIDAPPPTFTIVGGADAALFQIDAGTGALRFVGAPDFESPLDSGGNNVYDVTVQSSDGNQADTQAIAVTVTNLNDNAPVITSNGGGATGSTNVAENGTAVTTVTTTDADGSALSYSIVGGTDAALFQINALTGVLSFQVAPDFENPDDAGLDNVYEVQVRVSDGSFTDMQTLSVAVTDVNDNPPVITSNGGGTTASVSVAENGSAVTTVTATDADGPVLVYSIVGGADAALFQIDSSTGALGFTGAPDYENPTDTGANNVYDVSVQVSDGSTTDTQAIAVTVTDLNDNAPVITSNGGGATAAVTVAENALIVAFATALDADGSALAYSIVGGADAAQFTINASTGALRFAATRDFENPQDANADNVYDVTVQVSDGLLADTQALTVTVVDVNDNAPVITSGGGGPAASVAIAENSTSVTTVVATDADGQSLSYSIVGGADAALFQIDGSTGALRFVVAPDFENPQDADLDHVYDLTVQASDGLLADTQTIAVTVTNLNDNAPEITSNGGSASAAVSRTENGTAVTTVAANDADGSLLAFSIVGGSDAALFQIDASTGALRFVNAPDFENPQDAGGNNVYDVTVQASDGSFTDTQALAVTVTDLNDNAPVITSNGGGAAASVSVAENTTAVATVLASDADGPLLSYSIVGGADAALFQIDSGTGALTFIGAQDFESPQNVAANNVYDVTVQVSDGSLTDTQAIAVTVTNLNDNAPVIHTNGGAATAAVSVAENTTAVTTVTASDVDGSTPVYTIGGTDAARFQIDSATGVLRFIAAPDFENPQDAGTSNVYDLTVQASDGALSDTQAITVTVTNVNEGPVVTSAATANMAENSTAVLTVIATDVDGPTLGYAISGGADAALFSIDASTGALRFVGAPDYENPQDAGANNVYNLVVSASDGALSASQAITVTLTNANDAPTAALPIAAQNATEDAAFHFQFAANTFSDADQSDTLTYTAQLAGGGSLPAWLGFNTATRTFSGTPANADVGTVNINVIANDGAGGTATATFVLSVANVNDAPVVLTSGGAASYALGSAAIAIDSGLLVSDVDSASLGGASVAIGAHYAMGQDTLGFVNQNGIAGSWNAATGVLTLVGNATVADYQAALRSVTFSNGSATLGTATRTVLFTVTDGSATSATALRDLVLSQPNRAPVITSNGGAAAAALSIAENTTAVTPVTATDADGDVLDYVIVGGADAGLFSIDTSTGALRFDAAPDHAAARDADGNNVYEVVVLVSDGLLGDTQALSVAVTEASGGGIGIGPVTDADAAPNLVPESAATGTVVGITARASDPDSTDTVAYRLADDAGGRFAIDAASGVVTVANGTLLDFEAATGHDITVVASSSDGTTRTERFTVTVANVNEFGVSEPTDANVLPNVVSIRTVDGAAVGIAVQAFDADASTVVFYSLVDNASGRFAIDPLTGVVTVANSALVATGAPGDSYDIAVQVRSSDGSVRTALFSVRLGEDDFAVLQTPPLLPGLPGSASVTAPNGEATATSTSASAAKEPTATRTSLAHSGLSEPGAIVPATDPSGRLLSFEISHQNLLLAAPLSGLSERRASALSQVELLLEEEAERLRASSSTGARNTPEPSIELSSQSMAELPNSEPVIDAVWIGGTALSLGVAIWATRGGALLASMLATTPAWQNFDPVPVLSRPKPNRGIAGRQGDGAQDGQPTGDSVAVADNAAAAQGADMAKGGDSMASGTGRGASP